MNTQAKPLDLTQDDRIGMVRDAQEMIIEAYALIAQAVQGLPSEANTRAYVLDHLYILATSEHGFLSRDKNLDDVIRELEEDKGGSGCECGEAEDIRWDNETESMRCWSCGGEER
jgi:hypothetical protein